MWCRYSLLLLTLLLAAHYSSKEVAGRTKIYLVSGDPNHLEMSIKGIVKETGFSKFCNCGELKLK
ncbi:hypothetical protein SLEP1_g40536 [Rubroshorea leprosula]|uniref:Uncharacterized protein n=1 Tax=Rubroshorea leprosula TaxID=152421 RepID=A0AAV5L430_9ROSI|nr:hypothetical protein SLEP1_g40536 [Rubroshorea leprosula]